MKIIITVTSSVFNCQTSVKQLVTHISWRQRPELYRVLLSLYNQEQTDINRKYSKHFNYKESNIHLKKSVAFHNHVGQSLSSSQILIEVLLIWLPSGIFLLYDSIIEGESLSGFPHNTELSIIFPVKIQCYPDPRLSHFQTETMITHLLSQAESNSSQ